MDKETFLGLLGLLGGVFATVKMLLSAYFKKSEELEEVRRVNNNKAIDSLELTLENHGKLISFNTEQIKLLKDRITNLSSKLTEAGEESNRLVSVVNGYKQSTDKELGGMRSEFHKLSEVLAIIKVRKPQ